MPDVRCEACKGDGLLYILIKKTCVCVVLPTPNTNCKECNDTGVAYEIVPERCEPCQGSGLVSD